MKLGPANAKAAFLELITVEAEPKDSIDWLVEIILYKKWHIDENEARSSAEEINEQFIHLLRVEISQLHDLGRFAPFSFNSSSEYKLQGCAFPEPGDSETVRFAKRKRSFYRSYVEALETLNPRDFEALCAGILNKIGVSNPSLTKYSADEGIDFYGKLRLSKFLFIEDIYPGIQHQLDAWIIGQAKHYKNIQVSTNDIRDLVGSVELAKGKAYGSIEEKYTDLHIRACDPVFYLFITTGNLSANSWRLLQNSGVIGMDGEMVAAFLADRDVGTNEGLFNLHLLQNWIKSYQSPIDTE